MRRMRKIGRMGSVRRTRRMRGMKRMRRIKTVGRMNRMRRMGRMWRMRRKRRMRSFTLISDLFRQRDDRPHIIPSLASKDGVFPLILKATTKGGYLVEYWNITYRASDSSCKTTNKYNLEQ